MIASPIIAAVGRCVVDRPRRAGALPVGRAVPAAVGVAPAIAYWLSVPVGAARAPARRRRAARCCGARRARRGGTSRRSSPKPTRWLPPDNFQEERRRAARGAPHVADQHRHGPAVDDGRARSRLSHDREMLRRLDATLTTLEGLERHAVTSSTGTTRRRWRRCIRGTCRRSTAATSPARSSRWRRGCSSSSDDAADTGRNGCDGLADAADAARGGVLVGDRGSRPTRASRDRDQPARARNRAERAARSTPRRASRCDWRRRWPRSSLARSPTPVSRRIRRRAATSRTGAEAVLDGAAALDGIRAADRLPRLAVAGRARARHSPTACASIFSTTAGAGFSQSAIASPMPTVRDGSTARSTTCWPRRRGSPASSRSPRATSRSTTGSTSVGW